MLGQRGVAPVSESVLDWAQRSTGRASGYGLTSIVAAFRRDKGVKDAGEKSAASKGAAKKGRDAEQHWAALASQAATALLLDMGFPKELVGKAIEECGPRAQACADYCIRPQTAPSAESPTGSAQAEREEAKAAAALLNLGFSVEAATVAL